MKIFTMIGRLLQKPLKPFKWLVWNLATWFGCGEAPLAPGTVGTAGAVPLRVAMEGLRPGAYAVVTLMITLIGTVVSGIVEMMTGKKDDKRIVIDEVAGYLVATAGPLPPERAKEALFTGFILFRIMDILKPGLARRCERLPGGLGVMADDLVAGVWALILLRLWLLISPIVYNLIGQAKSCEAAKSETKNRRPVVLGPERGNR